MSGLEEQAGKRHSEATGAKLLKGAQPGTWASSKNVSTFGASDVVLESAKDIKPQPIRWLWTGWLALSKFHVLAGAPGQGKTTLALLMIATITSGGRWPDGSRAEPGNVLVWSGEDDPADTLIPRLIAMGANLDRVYFVQGARQGLEYVPFDPSRDLVALTVAAEKIGNIKLLLVDPVVSAVAGDSHKNTEVRRALQPLVDLGSALDAAVLGISHFSKGGSGRDPTERVVGSVAFSAVARVVLVAAKTTGDDGEDRRVLARSKSNIGPDDGGFEYSIEQVEVDGYPDVQASRIAWGQPVAGTARELLAEPDEVASCGARNAASSWLRDVLDGGPVPSKAVKADALEAGYSWSTVRRAADELGVLRKKSGLTEGWYWSIPKMLTETPKVLKMLTSESEQLRSTFGEDEEVF